MNLNGTISSIIRNTKQVQAFFWLLIVWLLFGFCFRLDNNMFIGCVIETEAIFGLDNVFYSFTSIILLTLGVTFQTKNNRIWFLLLELLFWLVKLFYWKGGYAVDIAGIPIFSVVFYDMIALCLRVLLLNSSLQLRFSNNYFLIPIILFTYIRLYFFR